VWTKVGCTYSSRAKRRTQSHGTCTTCPRCSSLSRAGGVIPVDGVEYPVETGDVVVIEAEKDHHARSSVEDPLVAVWYLMSPECGP